MMTYLVIGICLILLIIVIFISARPIGMGIEARRNLNYEKDENTDVNKENNTDVNKENKSTIRTSISDELIKLNRLKEDGIISNEDYESAKKKLLS